MEAAAVKIGEAEGKGEAIEGKMWVFFASVENDVDFAIKLRIS